MQGLKSTVTGCARLLEGAKEQPRGGEIAGKFRGSALELNSKRAKSAMLGFRDR